MESKLPHRIHEAYEKAGREPVNVFELFPELSDDIDRRIAHAETRLKFWIISAVMCNALAIILATLPSVYYLGVMSEKMSGIMDESKIAKQQLAARSGWMSQQEEWNRRVAEKVQLANPPPNHLDLEKHIEE